MSEPRYTVGIDLGTSNCAMSFALLDVSPAKVSDFPIRQLIREGQVAAQPLLPSALYSPPPGENLGLAPAPEWVAGQYARWRGGRVPGRLITSAKSWLCHPAIDRTANVLPWGGAPDVPKVSPVRASAMLLEEMRRAWDEAHPNEPLESQEVVITVPASFDEVARSLTVTAARQAGLEHFTLVEEPQAAFYHFSYRHQRDLERALENVRLAVIVDVGGGTTDFTLVQVAASADGPMMKRIAVGDHLILGGDNMDNAVARRVEEKLQGRKLSTAQWIQVVQAAREAKETLLRPDSPAEFRISIAGEGSKLLGGTISAVLTRDEVRGLVLEGFFPKSAATELPKTVRATGIQELGLPYVAEPAITRHVAAFLSKHARSGFEALGQNADSPGLPRPDAILFNGGVFNSAALADRLVEVLSSWWAQREGPARLEHENLDLAVARGAAYYGLVRHGRGRRISGGTAHSFYLGVAAEKGNAEQSAVCLIPRGMEEGETIELKDRVFKLHVGRPAQFPIYTSTGDQVDRPGDVVRVAEEFTPLPPIQTVLKSSRQRAEKIPVFLKARLSEIGTVELWCAATETPEQWRVEFDIRGTTSSETAVTEALPPRFAEAREYVAKIYGSRPGATEKGPRDVKQLWTALEGVLGPRESWNIAVLRQLWSELYAGAARRRRSAEHERIFFQLLGYTLRPGFGYLLDAWRAEQSFNLFADQVEFHKEKPNWNEFWVLWRRIGGGLSAQRQAEWWDTVKQHLALRLPLKAPKNLPRAKGPQPEGIEEMLRAAAAMEHLAAHEKLWLGNLVCERVREQTPSGGPWAWSLARLGARTPLYGSVHNVIAPGEIVPWIELMLAAEKLDGSSFALVQLCRISGDRARDIEEGLRSKVLQTLERRGVPAPWLETARTGGELKAADEARVFGDSLPLGLQLARSFRDQIGA